MVDWRSIAAKVASILDRVVETLVALVAMVAIVAIVVTVYKR